MDKKEKLINTLNNHFNLHNEFPEISQISDEDIEKIIELYEKEASKGGKDPWHYLYFDELIIMQKCVYEIIKDKEQYSKITEKIEILFEKELNRRLERTVYSYGEPTNETYRASYTEMPEYSLTLADMCSRHMQEAQNFIFDTENMPLTKIESSLKTYETIKSDFTKINQSMPEESEKIALQAKTMVVLANEERNAIVEREKQQREIELINLQQEINKVDNERLEIQKRIKTIASETLGSYFSRQISEKYPQEYQSFQQRKEQVRNYTSNFNEIADLKDRLKKVTEDLQFYKEMLPAYESYYQRFEEMKKANAQQKVDEKEQERIYNLIYSAENERLKQSRSLYTAWDLGNKTIPQEYQGMTYEQVENLIKQKELEKKAELDAKATRDALIEQAIRKDLGSFGNHHLSELQIKNLSQQFAGYSNEELQNFINGTKKEETVVEIKQDEKKYENTEKSIISLIETKNSNLGKVKEIISVSGYPDSTYEVRFENGEIHNVVITQDEKRNLSTMQQSNSVQIKQSETANTDLQQENNNLINQIIGAMTDAGEFNFGDPLDISGKMDAMNNVKNKLQGKSIEELQFILSTYSNQQEKIEQSGMHR